MKMDYELLFSNRESAVEECVKDPSLENRIYAFTTLFNLVSAFRSFRHRCEYKSAMRTEYDIIQKEYASLQQRQDSKLPQGIENILSEDFYEPCDKLGKTSIKSSEYLEQLYNAGVRSLALSNKTALIYTGISVNPDDVLSVVHKFESFNPKETPSIRLRSDIKKNIYAQIESRMAYTFPESIRVDVDVQKFLPTVMGPMRELSLKKSDFFKKLKSLGVDVLVVRPKESDYLTVNGLDESKIIEALQLYDSKGESPELELKRRFVEGGIDLEEDIDEDLPDFPEVDIPHFLDEPLDARVRRYKPSKKIREWAKKIKTGNLSDASASLRVDMRTLYEHSADRLFDELVIPEGQYSSVVSYALEEMRELRRAGNNETLHALLERLPEILPGSENIVKRLKKKVPLTKLV